MAVYNSELQQTRHNWAAVEVVEGVKEAND
jgi:hypothetical protein